MSELSDLVKMLKNNKESGSDYTGTVTRVDGNTAYVRLNGSDIMDTPAVMSIDAKVGDQVRVRIRNGKAWLTGNDTAPPTNDTKSIRQLQQAAEDSDKRVNKMQKAVDETAGLAANTNQYFWFTEEGSDTGAHVTEIPRKQFIADPENGGGNMLMRSNGLAIRNGLVELARMMSDGIQIGDDNGFRVVIGEDSIELLDSAGTTGFGIDLVGGSTDRIISNTYNYSASTTLSNTFNAPISTKTITFRLSSNGHTYTATKTNSQLSINSSFTLGSTSSDYLEITRTGTNSFSVDLWVAASGTTGSASLQVSYTVTRSTSTITYTGDNKVLWSGTGLYMSDTQSVTLSEPVKKQLSGIVLVWSAYVNGSAQNYDWFYQYIPKDHVIARNGQGVTTGLMINGSGTYAGVKYVYVYNDRITGNASNATSQSGSGISLQNTHWVLRYVLGV